MSPRIPRGEGASDALRDREGLGDTFERKDCVRRGEDLDGEVCAGEAAVSRGDKEETSLGSPEGISDLPSQRRVTTGETCAHQ
jgi:hypothetical protein